MGTQATERRRISLGFTEERVPEGHHVCYLFDDDEERLRVMARYFESGRQEGEKLLYLVDTMTPEEMTATLASLGVDTRAKPEGLAVADAATGYRPSGSFSADEMLDVARRFYREAFEEGYAGARAAGEMSWCLREGLVDLLALMEYEARLTGVLEEHPASVCCQYDVRRFDGQTIMDVLAVHPYVILRGQLVANPFFMDPRVFMEALQARSADPAPTGRE